MDQQLIKKAILSFNKKRVLVVGDLMLDHYTYGDVSRISPEAPIPIIKHTHEEFNLGGAANVANNLASLGGRVTLCGFVGDDRDKDFFMRVIKEQGIDSSRILIDKTKPTIVKHRMVSGNHQLLRVDREDTSLLNPRSEKALIAKVVPVIAKNDIVILSDYAKGVFSKKLVKEILISAKKHGKKVIADFKPINKELFIGVDLVSPNLKEAKEMTGLEDIQKIGRKLVKYFKSDVLITRGGDGITVFGWNKKHIHIPGKKVSVFDISGAGDTAIATVALSIASGLDLESAAHLANAAGAVVVKKAGTATLTSEELLSALNFYTDITNVGIVPKVWGYEKWLENNEYYCCKLLFLNKSYQCSLHYHKNKDELFVITKGHVRLEKNKEILHLREGAFVRLEPGTIHRFTGVEDSIIMEVSTHHDEKDNYRLEKSKRVA